MVSSTPRLSEYARKFVYPPTIVKTVWPRVEAKGLELGLGFDWWQSQLGMVCVGYGDDGKYVATVGGIGMSIPRQVGKTYFVLALLVIMCILFPGLQVVWTAHHLRTSTKTFRALQGICRRKKVAPYIAKNNHGRDAIRTANGEQQVEFTNGSMIMFGARAMGFGRGFDEIDIEVYDEAQILDTKALEDMVAATNQARHEHGALLFFMGTPPRPSDPSDAFTERRSEAWSGESEHSIWLEIGADPASDANDQAQWPAMNPSFPVRTPRESMLRLRKNLKDEDSWNREGRGIWDDDGRKSVIPVPVWSGLADRSEEPAPHVGKVVLGVDSDPDRDRTSIVAAGARAEGPPLIEVTADLDGVVDNRLGVDWAKARIIEICGRNDVAAVVIDKRSAAASLITPLEAAGVTVVTTTAQQMAQACGQLYDAATETGQLAHLDDPLLNAAIRGATTRPCGDAWAWDKRKPTVDITPLTAATLALWGWVMESVPPSNAGSGRVIAFS
jgi:phage terminase large subunit-like protein